MNILITGGAGFIGSHLCRKLLDRGNSVICADNFITGAKENIREFLDKTPPSKVSGGSTCARLCPRGYLCPQGYEGIPVDNPRFKLIEHDISTPFYIEEDLDWVMHFASIASPKDYLSYPIKTLKSGLLGTHNCLGLAKAKKAKFFLASTSEIYGDPLIHPQPEEYWGNVSCTGPRSCYDESKRAAESLTYAYMRQHNLDVRVVRIFNTFGPRMRINDGRVVSNFIIQALKEEDLTVYGKGTQTRSFCYVDDLTKGIVKMMEISRELPLNLGNPCEYKVIDLAETIIKLTGSRSKIKFLPLPEDDPKRRRPDISKARKILDWQPQVSLKEGLAKTIEYFKEKLQNGEKS